ncbi:hypothetical protein A9P44_00195 [Paenibacillus polymyxa]|nr:hypothetical protein [Paenibacillus polymyxa]OBA07808.1 hypothetical protein A9P44_00195 [Paenibacillus polymyxa]
MAVLINKTMNIHNLSTKMQTKFVPSTSPCEADKEAAEQLKALLKSTDFLEKNSLQSINFDLKVKKRHIQINSVYLVEHSGDVVQVPFKHAIETRDSSKTLRKVGAFVMPMGYPSFIQMYANEMKEMFERSKLKYWFTVVGTFFVSLFGVQLAALLAGLFFIALVDLILGLIPGNIKPGTEKEHKSQAKLMTFATNFFILLGMVSGCEYLKVFTNGNGFFGIIAENLHYPVATWIYSNYFWRMVKYAARANKVKIPAVIRKLFDKDISG